MTRLSTTIWNFWTHTHRYCLHCWCNFLEKYRNILGRGVLVIKLSTNTIYIFCKHKTYRAQNSNITDIFVSVFYLPLQCNYLMYSARAYTVIIKRACLAFVSLVSLIDHDVSIATSSSGDRVDFPTFVPPNYSLRFRSTPQHKLSLQN